VYLQCTYVSVVHKKVTNFTTSILDDVLIKGDALYNRVVLHLQNEGLFMSYLLQFEELPDTVEVASSTYTIVKQNVVSGTITEMASTVSVLILAVVLF